MTATSVVWFRRDLRLADNPAWSAGTLADRVCPLFVLDPALFDAVSDRRRALLIGGLHALDDRLRSIGGQLRVEYGDPRAVVPSVAAEVSATVVHVNAEVTPYGSRRDRAVAERIQLEEHDGVYVHPPGAVLTDAGTPYRVFTPFHRRWSELPVPAVPEPGAAVPTANPGAGIPDGTAQIAAGEDAARRRLDDFLGRVDRYDEDRDRFGIDGTSRLSIDLKYGWISATTVLTAAAGDTPGRRSFVRQLAWRDFYGHLLAFDPSLVDRPMRSEYDGLAWRDAPDDLGAWETGTTGYPIVDAAMRQLVADGWIHNRLRMLAASFLVKDLLIDWRLGERFFRRHLLDGDIAQNAGNWQWVAGTGTDAAPYFRVFNPITQSRRYDASGSYIRRWIPELAGLPDHHLHAPWEATDEQLVAAGVALGETYPAPLIDHAAARRRALDAYGAVKRQRPSVNTS
jgi:deoxyribodipyrimidine photo-lyase